MLFNQFKSDLSEEINGSEILSQVDPDLLGVNSLKQYSPSTIQKG